MPVSNDVIRANKKYAGLECAICKTEISLGDLIHICPKCQSINHEKCWQNEGGCNSFSCNSLSSSSNNSSLNNNFQGNNSSSFGNSYQSPTPGSTMPRSPGNFPHISQGNRPQPNSPMSRQAIGGFSQAGGGFQQTNAPSQNMVPCKFCKEPIMRGAKKCKHCGEYQSDEDRKNSSQFGDGDDSFTVGDVFAILCCPSLAGVIVGTVYCSRYQVARGVRVLKYSIIWSIISSALWGILNVMAAVARHP